MYGLKVRIRAVIDESFPTWVECVMTDHDGQTHIFREQLPAVSAVYHPMIPGEGVIRCTLVQETEHYADIDTSLPDGVESTMGVSRFRVARSDLTEDA